MIVLARHLAMYLARMFTGSSFASIGIYFGGRDSASVRYACKITALRLQKDPALAAVAASFEPRRPQSSTPDPRMFG
jgi:chromosomal replication initiator protein